MYHLHYFIFFCNGKYRNYIYLIFLKINYIKNYL